MISALLLAEASVPAAAAAPVNASAAAAPDASYVAIGLVVVGLSALVQLALAAKQLLAPARGDDPTAAPASLTAIAGELRTQTATLNKLDREMGGVVTTIASFQRELGELKATHTKDIDAAHQRLAGLSRDLAGTIVRVDGLEKREHTA